jgi:uroporphyrinogen-III synthase
MNTEKIQILSTRPLDDDLVGLAAQQGIILSQQEFIKTVPVVDENLVAEIRKLAKRDIVAVFTSMNAVESVSTIVTPFKPTWRVASIGATTLQLVQKYFTGASIIATGESATDLAHHLADAAGGWELHFFCSNIRRNELPQVISEYGLKLQEWVVYETYEIPVQLQQHYHGILFFSPSAVRSFFSGNKLDANVVLFATGNTTASEIGRYCSNEVVVAANTGKGALVQRALEYFKTQNGQKLLQG